MNEKYLWMKITNDKYELPIAIADSAAELARMTGTTKNNVCVSYNQLKNGKRKFSKYIKVTFD